MKIYFVNIIKCLPGILFCFTFHFSSAQSIEREVFASSGAYSFNNSVQVEWTIGEIATEFYTNSKSMVTIGFHQTDIDYVGISDVNQESFFRIYPNPTADFLYVELAKNTNVSVRIFNLMGNEVFESSYKSTERILIQLKEFSSGMYNIVLTNDDLNQSEVHRIIKK